MQTVLTGLQPKGYRVSCIDHSVRNAVVVIALPVLNVWHVVARAHQTFGPLSTARLPISIQSLLPQHPNVTVWKLWRQSCVHSEWRQAPIKMGTMYPALLNICFTLPCQSAGSVLYSVHEVLLSVVCLWCKAAVQCVCAAVHLSLHVLIDLEEQL
jgi:hypothetical protein